MGARILGIELRRSVALWAALLIAAVGVFVLFTSNPPYGSWMELAIVQRDIMQLTWPLALGAGAWQGSRERRSRVEELLATTPRPRRSRVLPVAAAMAIAAAAAYLVMFAGGAGHLDRVEGYFSYGVIPLVALGALALVGAAWLGMAIGALLPSPLTAPTLVVVGFVGLSIVPQALTSRPYPGTFLLLPFLQAPRNFGSAVQMLSARADLSQALWLAAVAATGLALVAAGRPGARLAAVVPVLVGAVIAVPVMPRPLAAAWVEDGRATRVVCTADEPEVCLSRVQAHLLGTLRGPAREALSILAAKLPQPPTRVEVRNAAKGIPDAPQSADLVLVFLLPTEDVSDYAQDRLMGMLLSGAGVRPCVNQLGFDPTQFTDEPRPDPDWRYLAARQAVSRWLLDGDPEPASRPGSKPGGGDESEALAGNALAALRALPAGEQVARITAFRAAELTCAEGDRLDLLTGTSAPR
jgi:hypothetical protein